jgi:hypothetical protein
MAFDLLRNFRHLSERASRLKFMSNNWLDQIDSDVYSFASESS